MHTAAADKLVSICHRLYDKGLVSGTDGNVSLLLPSGNILTTRSAINKGAISHGDLVEVSPDGSRIEGVGDPSTELKMHLFIYTKRPDAGAVVHAHPPYATSFAVAGIPLDRPVLPEVLIGLGGIPLAPYATPGTEEVPASLEPIIGTHAAVLLANHGAVTFGADLDEAYFRMEKLEHAARVLFHARMLGGVRELTRDQVEKLRNHQSYRKDT